MTRLENEDDSLSVPPQTITKDRQVVDTSGVLWQFRVASDGGTLHQLDWMRLTEEFRPRPLSPRSIRIFQIYLAQRLSYSKGHTVRNDFETIMRFLRWCKFRDEGFGQTFSWQHLTLGTFRDFLELGMKSSNKGNDFARLRDFYAWGAFSRRFPEFDQRLALSLKSIRAQGNVKGAAVRFAHSTKGPLVQSERDEIMRSLHHRHTSPEQRAIIMIHLELGLNPQSVARLKNADLKKFEVNIVQDERSSRVKRYQLEIPRVKKRGEFRETKSRPISAELGELLESIRTGGPDQPLFYWLNENYPERHITKLMNEFVEAAQIISPRTKELLKLSPRRFRYTLATEAAREGASKTTIALLLDHSDLQNVDVYVEASSYVIDQIGENFDKLFEPVARQFRGKIVDKGDESAFSDVAPKVIPSRSAHLPLLDIGGIGMCGRDVRKDGLCNLAPPLTCYACEFFAAFRNGPHVQVVTALEKIKTELVQSSDVRIPMQLDTVISAARQLIGQITAEDNNAG